MNPETAELLKKINNAFREYPLFYFSRDVERSTGLEDYLKNYNIVCVEDNYIVDNLSKKGLQVFCAEKEGVNLHRKSTRELLSNGRLQRWIKEGSKQQYFYCQLFKSTGGIVHAVNNLGGKLFNNDPSLGRKFEDKISQYNILSGNGIPFPKTKIVLLEVDKYKEAKQYLGDIFVVQLNRAHTGTGTFKISSEKEWLEIVQNFRGNEARCSQYVEGAAYTINACVTGNGIFVAGLQYQITGIQELASGEGVTVGNDWSYANSILVEHNSRLVEIVNKIGKIMQGYGYLGVFGVDLVLGGNEWKVIEVNARQTANLPLQSKLELEKGVMPLLLLNLAAFLGINIDTKPAGEIAPLSGSQIFLRSKQDKVVIKNEFEPGIYILAEEETLKKVRDGYSISDLNNSDEFVVLSQREGLEKSKNEELSRLQFKKGIVKDGKVDGKVLNILNKLENFMLYDRQS